MYKVFIENSPVYIVQKLQKTTEERVVIHSEKLKVLRTGIFEWAQNDPLNTPIYIVSKRPESAFAALFEKFEFIEAAGGIVKREDKYLLIKRNGVWDIPKGKLDAGENIERCAVREIEEECGIVNPVLGEPLINTYHTYTYKGRPTIKKTYWYRLDYDGPKKLTPQKKEGITKAKWLSRDEVYALTMETYGSIREVIDTYFEEKGA